MSEKDGKRTQVCGSVLNALISGTISSTVTTVMYQPLELLKTQIQLKHSKDEPVLGRLTRSSITIVKERGLKHLWTGTGPSLLRSGPGVGLYYALLNILQTNFSAHNNKPDNPGQAFYFGLAARSLVSFMLLPVTVVKVRYESGLFQYKSLTKTIASAYSSQNGWVGVMPTILRDSLFSGVYYMCYTGLKNKSHSMIDKDSGSVHARNFICGISSGLIASTITNPIDVVKTNVQASKMQIGGSFKAIQATKKIMSQGYTRFLDGLVPRSIRRTIVAATTWTIYELMTDTIRH